MNKTIKNTLSGALLCAVLIAAMAATTVLLASCTETDMDINKLKSEPKMVVYCFPQTESDTTCITLMRSVAVTDPQINSLDGLSADSLLLPGAHVTFRQNGVERTVKYAEESTLSVPKGCYYVVGDIAEGDQIEIEASAAGLPSVSAKTTVPVAQPVKRVRKTTVIHDQEEYIQLLVDVDGAAMRGGYYAVTVSFAGRVSDIDIAGNEYESDIDERKTIYTDDEPLLSPTPTDQDLFDFDIYFHNDFYIFNGSNITSDSYTMKLNIYDYWDSGLEQSGFTIKDPRYTVRLYRVDPILYKFLKSVNDMESNDLAKWGLAPVLPTFSNINGGVGVLGGCSVAQKSVLTDGEPYD